MTTLKELKIGMIVGVHDRFESNTKVTATNIEAIRQFGWTAMTVEEMYDHYCYEKEQAAEKDKKYDLLGAMLNKMQKQAEEKDKEIKDLKTAITEYYQRMIDIKDAHIERLRMEIGELNYKYKHQSSSEVVPPESPAVDERMDVKGALAQGKMTTSEYLDWLQHRE